MNRYKRHVRQATVAVAVVVLTALTPQSASAAFPGTNGKIAFTSNRDGNNEIYVMNADGTGQTRLTNSAASESQPAWSPDGSKIAFTSRSNANSQIYVMNADGSGQTQLTHAAFGGFGQPAWSPDGSKIAVTAASNAIREIWVMNADGSGQTILTSSELDFEPAWSPGGTEIAFSSGRDGNTEVYLMNADGTGQTRLTTSASVESQPAWSPDGAKIAFTTDRDSNDEIYVMNADGTGQTRLTNNAASDSDPDWQPVPSTVDNFSIVGSPDTLTVEPGGSATSTISTSLTTGSAQTISLAASGLPGGATAAFDPSSVSSGDSSTLTVSAGSSTSPGTYSLTITGTGSAATHSTTVTLTVNPSSPQALVAPTSIDFGVVPVGTTSAHQTVTITNVGGQDLLITSETITGSMASEFSFVHDTCTTGFTAPGSSCTIELTFTPSAGGSRSATLTIGDNGVGGPHTVALSGTGGTLSADVQLVMSGPVSAPRGAQVTYLITIWNAGPSTAHNVVLSNPVPIGGKFLGITTSQGTCSKPTKGKVTCSLGDLASGGSAGSVVTIKLTARVGSTVTNLASAFSTADAKGPATPDPDTSNNWASATTLIAR